MVSGMSAVPPRQVCVGAKVIKRHEHSEANGVCVYRERNDGLAAGNACCGDVSDVDFSGDNGGEEDEGSCEFHSVLNCMMGLSAMLCCVMRVWNDVENQVSTTAIYIHLYATETGDVLR